MVHTVLAEESAPRLVSHSPDGLVNAFRHLCRRGARKFRRTGLERADLEQVAAIGLIKAARRYDPALGTPFEAYAWLFVVGELMHYVRDHEGTIRLPRRLIALERRATRARERLATALGREPTDPELAAELGVLLPAVVELRTARELASLNPLDEGGAETSPPDESLGIADRLMVNEALRALAPTERCVIVGVYLIGFTQLELSHRLGISPKRVSRIQARALDCMARALAS